MTPCPTCSTPLLSANGGADAFCPTCWAAQGGRMPPREAGTPQNGTEGHFRGKEADLVAQIVKALKARGRTVLRVGQFRADMAGSTAGTPDLFCWTGFGWQGLEVKTATGRLSPAQKVLAAAGMVRVVRSVSEAVEIVEEAEAK